MHRTLRIRFLRSIGVLAALVLAAPAGATVVRYDAALQDDGSWRYHYVVSVSAQGDGVGQFAVFFARELYANLRDWSAPTGWDALIQQPANGPGLVDDGLVDFCSQGPLGTCDGARIAPGSALGGFSVAFDWLGSGLPDRQTFEVRDPDDFALVFAGTTVGAAAVPAPPAVWLMTAGLFGVLAVRRRRAMSVHPPRTAP